MLNAMEQNDRVFFLESSRQFHHKVISLFVVNDEIDFFRVLHRFNRFAFFIGITQNETMYTNSRCGTFINHLASSDRSEYRPEQGDQLHDVALCIFQCTSQADLVRSVSHLLVDGLQALTSCQVNFIVQ
ncbi:hypothetical protein D3C72_2122870 [compost metagenome]